MSNSDFGGFLDFRGEVFNLMLEHGYQHWMPWNRDIPHNTQFSIKLNFPRFEDWVEHRGNCPEDDTPEYVIEVNECPEVKHPGKHTFIGISLKNALDELTKSFLETQAYREREQLKNSEANLGERRTKLKNIKNRLKEYDTL